MAYIEVGCDVLIFAERGDEVNDLIDTYFGVEKYLIKHQPEVCRVLLARLLGAGGRQRMIHCPIVRVLEFHRHAVEWR